jgi:hypothetical protein
MVTVACRAFAWNTSSGAEYDSSPVLVALARCLKIGRITRLPARAMAAASAASCSGVECALKSTS